MDAEARKVIENLQEKNEDLSLENERLACERNEQEQKLELLQEKVNDLLHRLYGRKSERFENPNQTDLLKLLNWSGDTETPENSDRDRERIEYTRERPKKRGPKPLPEHLEREDVFIDPPEDERICACCSKPMVRVGEVVTEELEITPPQFRVKRYVQGKWRCLDDMNRDRIEPLPPRPIKKGRPSPSLLAYIVISKYLDHRVPRKAMCEMRERPLAAGLQDLAANHFELLRSRSGVVSVKEKARLTRQVGVGETSASEPLTKRRKYMLSSKPRIGGCLGTNVEDTCLPTTWRPALRRREFDSGSHVELGNLSSRCQGRRPSGSPARTRVPMRGTGTEWPIVVLKAV